LRHTDGLSSRNPDLSIIIAVLRQSHIFYYKVTTHFNQAQSQASSNVLNTGIMIHFRTCGAYERVYRRVLRTGRMHRIVPTMA
jgi:hypothetical protein